MATLLFRRKGDQITKVTTTGSGLTTVVPNSGGFLYYYQTGTTTLQTTFADAAGTTPNTNPLELDSDGRLQTSVYFGDSSSYVNYRENMTDSSGASVSTLWPIDDLACASPVATSSTVFAAPYVPWVQKTSSASPVTLLPSDAGSAYESDTTGGSITYNLPSAVSVGVGKGFWFNKLVSANSQTLHPSGVETINGANADYTVTRKNAVHLLTSNGAGWDVTTSSYATAPVTRCVVDALVCTNNSTTPATKWDVNADNAILTDANGDYIITGLVDLTIDSGVVGANGIDSGILTVSTWYYDFLISNGTTVAGLISLSSTNPTLPTGYTYKYRIGSIVTDSVAPSFERLIRYGDRTGYKVVAGSTTPNLPILISGSTGNVSTPSYTTVSTSAFVPPTAKTISIVSINNGSSATSITAPSADYGPANSLTNTPLINHASSTNTGSRQSEILLETSNIYHASNNANTLLACIGWTDKVNAS
jgi:hypothetical protein